ncbi:MAG: RNA polymerase sigma factor [Patescibacteria group bacterium]|nr:RNA polymerase sigma factor [Patescibacteria group bacterium]MDE2015788.1 RNA polymerase sigma factor [Patescibacteria group bacterium]MDE2226845.1 RNA polymerase sigma factor [Patescibacteria group bacterium]
MKLNIGQDNLTRLALRAKNGDKGAAEGLYDNLFSKTFGFCMNRLRNRELAEDLTQDIFLKTLDNLDGFDKEKGNFVVWFWRLAHNTIIDYFRAKKSQTFSDLSEMFLDSMEDEGGRIDLDVKFEAEILKKFVNTLTSDEKEIFELRYIAELSYSEIAEIAAKSEGALRVSASRLKQKIRDHFQK